MKKRQMILKISAGVVSALSIVALFLHFITLRNGDTRYRYKFGSFSGTSDALVIISRILFITTIVVCMALLVSLILQFIIKNDILDWIVTGCSVLIMITASLCFVSTLLYCLSISKLGSHVYFPSIGCYWLLIVGIAAPVLSVISNRK